MIICDTEENVNRCTSPYGNDTIVLTCADIQALLDGKTLGDPDFNEYGTFIVLSETDLNILKNSNFGGIE